MLKNIHLLNNPIQHYAWGSHTAIAELTGRPTPTEKPEAELWMGAHPKAPSAVVMPRKGEISLLELIARHPIEILGERMAAAGSKRLPYLFKVLAVERALSIQAHPNLAQAREGFERENRLNIALDAAERNYRDDNHKPELICALTPFWALNGFRSLADMTSCLKRLCPAGLADGLSLLSDPSAENGLRKFIEHLLSMDKGKVHGVLSEALGRAGAMRAEDPVCDWVVRLHDAYPGDVGALFACILKLVRLEPGQAMFLPAGQLHAYLDGVGIELMANSDNVLRGGLTPKHVDVPELLRVLAFREQPLEILRPRPKKACENAYATPAREFELSVIRTSDRCTYRSGRERSADILLAIEGRVVVAAEKAGGQVELARGMAAVVPAAVERYRISGEGTVYRAGVPL